MCYAIAPGVREQVMFLTSAEIEEMKVLQRAKLEENTLATYSTYERKWVTFLESRGISHNVFLDGMGVDAQVLMISRWLMDLKQTGKQHKGAFAAVQNLFRTHGRSLTAFEAAEISNVRYWLRPSDREAHESREGHVKLERRTSVCFKTT